MLSKRAVRSDGPFVYGDAGMPKTSIFPALSALTLRETADKYAALSAGGELRQSERPAPKIC
jgi:hypothetical protein